MSPGKLLAVGATCLVMLAGGATAWGLEIRSLQLDREHSSIEVDVRATLDSFEGRVVKYEAEIGIDPAGPSVERARFRFAFADLRTGRRRRDRDMLEWCENARHPVAEFRLERLERTPAAPVLARGRLEIHGIEHTIVFPVSFLVDGPLFAIDGYVRLDYRDFGLPVIRKFLLLTVDPHLRVRFHLQGRLAADGEVPRVAAGGRK